MTSGTPKSVAVVNSPLLSRAPACGERNVWKEVGKYLVIGSCVALAQSGALLLLAGMVRRHRRSNQVIRRLMQRIIQVREEEHLHLARELHDNIGQRLSLLSMRLASLRDLHSKDSNNANAVRESIRELDALISEIHGLSHSMHSSRLEHLGLEDALGEMCENISQRYPLQVDLQVSGEPLQVDPGISLCFYRIAQEALNNVVKHSRATEAHIFLVRADERLAMEVKDSGVGFDSKMAPVGLGFASMEERVLSVHGTLSIESSPGKGTAIKIEAPMHPRKAPGRGAFQVVAPAMSIHQIG